MEDRWLGGRGGRGVKTSKHKQRVIGYLGDAIVGDRPCHRDGCAHPAGHLDRVWKVWNFRVWKVWNWILCTYVARPRFAIALGPKPDFMKIRFCFIKKRFLT